VAARATGESKTATLSATVASTSPLARHDQRLNLPGFAELAPVVGQVSQTGPQDAAAVSADAPSPVVVARTDALGDARQGSRQPARLVPHEGWENISAPSAIGQQRRTTVETRAVENRTFEPELVARSPQLEPKVPPARPPVTEPSMPRPAKVTTPLPDGSRLEVRTTPVEAALRDVNRWLHSSRREPGTVRPSATMESAQRARSAAAAPAPALRRRAAGPRLTIGSIHVEVVSAPVPPSRREEVAKRVPRTVSAPAATPAAFRPAFGWRQR
jgi:hypothetical protein